MMISSYGKTVIYYVLLYYHKIKIRYLGKKPIFPWAGLHIWPLQTQTASTELITYLAHLQVYSCDEFSVFHKISTL
jgi:hypothetical protein